MTDTAADPRPCRRCGIFAPLRLLGYLLWCCPTCYAKGFAPPCPQGRHTDPHGLPGGHWLCHDCGWYTGPVPFPVEPEDTRTPLEKAYKKHLKP